MDITEIPQDVKVTVHGAPWQDSRIKRLVNQLEQLGVHKLDTQTKHAILTHVMSTQFPYQNQAEEFQYLCSDVVERVTGRPSVVEHRTSVVWDLLLQLCVQLKQKLPVRTVGQRIHCIAVVRNSHVMVAAVPICRTDDDDYDPKDSLYFNEEQEHHGS